MAERAPLAGERGAALLTVLLLVAVMSVVTATVLERVTLATKLAGNVGAIDQARAYAIGAEAIAAGRIADLIAADPNRTTLAGGWNGGVQPLPIAEGQGAARVSDGGNCFNLNSVVSGSGIGGLAVRPQGIAQFRTLMELVGVDSRAATGIAAAAADWIDSDSSPQPGGAEDDYYAQQPTPYRTANTLMADPSELRAVAGVTPQIYAALRPWICALPVSDLSPLNVNTLLPEQAPLVAMLMPGQMSLGAARELIARRPAEGFATNAQFWAVPALAGQSPDLAAASQTGIRTRWFALYTVVRIAGATSEETALFDARTMPVRLVRRRWGEPG